MARLTILFVLLAVVGALASDPSPVLLGRSAPASKDADGVQKSNSGDSGVKAVTSGAPKSGAQPEKSNVDGTQPRKSNVDGAQPEKSIVDGAQPKKSNVDGAQPKKSNVDGAQPKKSNVDGTQPEKSSAASTQPGKGGADNSHDSPKAAHNNADNKESHKDGNSVQNGKDGQKDTHTNAQNAKDGHKDTHKNVHHGKDDNQNAHRNAHHGNKQGDNRLGHGLNGGHHAGNGVHHGHNERRSQGGNDASKKRQDIQRFGSITRGLPKLFKAQWDQTFPKVFRALDETEKHLIQTNAILTESSVADAIKKAHNARQESHKLWANWVKVQNKDVTEFLEKALKYIIAQERITGKAAVNANESGEKLMLARLQLYKKWVAEQSAIFTKTRKDVLESFRASVKAATKEADKKAIREAAGKILTRLVDLQADVDAVLKVKQIALLHAVGTDGKRILLLHATEVQASLL